MARKPVLAAIRLWLALLAAALLAGTPALAQTSDGRDNHIAAELVVRGPALPGESTMLALRMVPEAGWHGYWLNPGDAGLGMTLDWQLPAGAKPGTPAYPVPGTLLIAGLMNHVYDREYAVLVPLTLPAGARPGDSVPVTVDARWLACSDTICVPEGGRLSAVVPVGPANTADPRFDGWEARLPAPLDAPARFELTDGRIRLAIPLPRDLVPQDPHLFVVPDKLIDYAAPQVFRRVGDMLVVELARARIAAISPEGFSALLRLGGEDGGLMVQAVPGPVPRGGEPLRPAAGPELPALPLLLLAALAGGVLLNIMPCVFPILSLKALALARAGESTAHARAEGLAYTAGVMLACIGLGALLLVLRAGGEQVGWAFQLQEPAVVAGLLLLAVAITANLLGFYELALPSFAQTGSAGNAFATGLLAAFVATPCTGPFMAAAIGAALLLPPLPALALFAALGLGIALPFLLVALVPRLRTALPRPGPWMATFRRWMALPMGLTALALLWLASRLGGADFALALGGCVLALTGLLALVGGRQRTSRPARGAALAALGVMVAAIALVPRTVSPPTPVNEGVLPAERFSQVALDEARAGGKPVFVWFTADWCLTCKVNERVAIEREDVRQAFAAAGVTAIKGDWTRRDPAITRFLTEHGAAGVPLYLWYPAGGGVPEQLPQVLGPSSLKDMASR